MIDNLTRDDIVKSLFEIRRPRKVFGEIQGLTDYVRKAVRRADWCESARNGETPPWERAYAHVVAVQDFLRRCDDRLPDGAARSSAYGREIAPGPVIAQSCPVQVLAAVEPNEQTDTDDGVAASTNPKDLPPYGYDGGGANGGISGAGSVYEIDDKKNHKALYGVAAFGSVQECGGIPELAWYFCASGFEVGLSSNFDALIQVLATGAPLGCGDGTAPTGPGPEAVEAASRQTAVMRALRKVPLCLQSVLEVAYEDRRCKTQDVTEYGHGLALMVARVRAVHKRFIVSQAGKAVAVLQRAMMALGGHGKRRVEQWRPATKQGAAMLLAEAHAAYLSAMGQSPPRRRKTRPVAGYEPAVLVAAGSTGANKRKLVEVRREAA